MIEGACSLAITNNSLTILDPNINKHCNNALPFLPLLLPSPMYFCTSSEPETLIKVHSVWWATALANSVLPVPGGPYNNTPLREGEGRERGKKGRRRGERGRRGRRGRRGEGINLDYLHYYRILLVEQSPVNQTVQGASLVTQ